MNQEPVKKDNPSLIRYEWDDEDEDAYLLRQAIEVPIQDSESSIKEAEYGSYGNY
jgi:hypothetical protein